MVDPLDHVLGKLESVTGRNKQYTAKCPAHPDDQPSLRISVGKEDQVLLKCQRGNPCSVEDIVSAMGLEMKDLWPASTQTARKPKKQKKLTDTYKYYDADGDLVMEVLRYLLPDGKKSFQQRRPDPTTGGWNWSMGDTQKPLYRLPQVLRAIKNDVPVWVVEGEKDVHTLESLEKVATTNPGGAGGPGQRKWLPHHTEALRDAKVILVSDNDDPGRYHVYGIKKELIAVNAKVKVLSPPAQYKDVTDLIEDGGSLRDLKPFDVYEWYKNHENADDQEAQADHQLDIDEFIAEAALIADKEDVDAERKADLIRRKAETLAAVVTGYEVDKGKRVEWRPFLEEKVDLSYDWIIPQLLERQDRVIVVASEGAGKTTLARQMAMLCSAGIHPFKGTDMDPIRTLMIDLENPERIIRRTTGRIYQRIKSLGRHEMMDGANLVIKSDGVNLLKQPDRDMIEEHIAETRPDIVFFGPIYKSFLDPGGMTAEAICTQLVRYFDYLRTEYDVAMWMEHHAPLGTGGNRELRPFGSAVWSRWSEFGIALRMDPTDPELFEFNHYRGQREPREWPILCRRGNTWPFEVVEFADFHEHENDITIANNNLAEIEPRQEEAPW